MRTLRFAFLGILVISAPSSFAETVELVTYYPSSFSGEAGRLHVQEGATVGDPYSLTSPAYPMDGILLVSNSIGIGPGFGATPPQGALHVTGAAGEPDKVLFQPGAGGTMSVGIGVDDPAAALPSLLALGVNTGAAGTRQAITVGNAGLGAPSAEGTQSPGDKLVLWNDSTALNHKAAIGLNANSELWLQSSGNNANNKIAFYTSNGSATPSPRLVINAAGSVGIGTATPDPGGNGFLLDIFGGALLVNMDSSTTHPQGLLIRGASDNSKGISMGYNTSSGYGAIQTYVSSLGGGVLSLQLEGGTVGIGTSTPTGFLEVAGSMRAHTGGVVILPRPSPNQGGYLSLSGHPPYEAMLLDNHQGNFRVVRQSPNAAEAFAVQQNGTVSGLFGTYHAPSDGRLKRNITAIPRALDKVLALRGVNFRWKDPAQDARDGLGLGFVAQEVESVIPEAVHTASDESGTKAVHYDQLTAVLVEAVKEQQKQIEVLKERLAELEASREETR